MRRAVPGRAVPATGVSLAASPEYPEECAAEHSGINLYSERGLHAQLKRWAGREGGRFEVPVSGKIVDLVRPDGEIVEIQTAKFGAIQEKVLSLAGAGHRVRIIHPVIAMSHVTRLDPGTGEVLSRRKSPRRGTLLSVFDEMIHAPRLIGVADVIVEVLLVEVEDFRTNDGRGSWRRKGDSLLDRRLVSVRESFVFGTPADWFALLPGSGSPWTSASLSAGLGIRQETARKMLYALLKAGLLSDAGKRGRLKLYSSGLSARRE